MLATLFVASGFSAVAYQVVLSRYVQLIVGGTAYAVSALLVAFMIGMSAGSAAGGALADRARHPLRVYALAEAAIGLYCLAFPLLFPHLQALYLDLAPPIGGPAGPRNLVRFVLGASAFVVPSFFMGVTTPAYVRALVAGRAELGRTLARLYALNVFGAAAGALVTAYVLVPLLGLVGSMALGAALNAAVCAAAWRLSRPVADGEAALASSEPGEAAPVRLVAAVLLAAAASGFLSFALEVLWTHLLAILIGNSVYAFGLMLGALLLGLSLGAWLAERRAEPRERAESWLGGGLMLGGAAVLATLGLWDRVPAVFLALARSSPGFAAMEAVRFAVAFTLMLLPTAFVGMAFPLAMRLAGTRSSGLGRRIGLVYAVNTLGAVAGAVLGSYWILPALGSLGSLRLLGVALVLAGTALVAALRGPRRSLLPAAAGLGAAVLGAVLPVHWDFNALNVAAAVYLGRSTSGTGTLVFRREDATGGLTTVVESRGVRTLLTNGKFQGDDSEEVPIQHRLANLPTLFTGGRERALVVGLGTGVTLAALEAHGFSKVVCAELSDPIVEAARAHFARVNGNVLDRPSVELVRDDGRSVLLEREDLYDVVSVEVTTIWFAGVGNIYSEDFYRLVASRLKRQGVLLQWFPLHHLSARNLYLVVNTVRSVFPYVTVWNHRHQGFVVASREPLQVDLASVRADVARPGLAPYLRELQSGSPLELLGDLVVSDADADRFLDALAELLFTSRRLVSTDVWPAIEYGAPKDVLDNLLYFQNRALLKRFRSRRPPPFRGVPTATEDSLASAAFAHGWTDPRAVPRLASAWAGSSGLTAVSSRWLFDELSGEDVEGLGLDSDPAGELAAASATVGSFLASARVEASCRPAPGYVDDPAVVPASVASSFGQTLPPTQPEAAVDLLASPDWGTGWRVRPDGAPPRVDVSFDRPRPVESVHVVVRPIDGRLVRTRLFARDAGGRLLPLAGGGTATELDCRDDRVYRLSPGAAPIAGLRLELQGEAMSHRIALHEIWAVERR